MAGESLFDTPELDYDHPVYTTDDIEAINPHRGHMRHLDGIVFDSDDHRQTVAYKNVRDDEFWVAGHIPGRPVFPGVLMLEAGAQLASFQATKALGDMKFIGFVGVDAVKFRGQVIPGDRFVLLSDMIDLRRRRCIANLQGYVDGKLVFEGQITGMPI